MGTLSAAATLVFQSCVAKPGRRAPLTSTKSLSAFSSSYLAMTPSRASSHLPWPRRAMASERDRPYMLSRLSGRWNVSFITARWGSSEPPWVSATGRKYPMRPLVMALCIRPSSVTCLEPLTASVITELTALLATVPAGASAGTPAAGAAAALPAPAAEARLAVGATPATLAAWSAMLSSSSQGTTSTFVRLNVVCTSHGPLPELFLASSSSIPSGVRPLSIASLTGAAFSPMPPVKTTASHCPPSLTR
mmetsp:Transcript_26930/g.91936  ORF Transcript_26930/g.91936 Transcript_26930/m.91936 type:complete len:249 (+) Transcript_26930:726-1472(+)